MHGVAVGKRACGLAGWRRIGSYSGVGGGITVLGVLLAHQKFPTTAPGYRQRSPSAVTGMVHRLGGAVRA